MILYHNPRCSKSRAALEWLQGRDGLEVRDYQNQPLDEAGLRALAAKLGLTSPRGMMRVNDELFRELKLDTANDDQLYAALAAHPKLLERPILELADRAAIGRPLENIQALLGS